MGRISYETHPRLSRWIIRSLIILFSPLFLVEPLIRELCSLLHLVWCDELRYFPRNVKWAYLGYWKKTVYFWTFLPDPKPEANKAS